ncbi:hypothetical protein CAPTEDRAFT_200476 [Capitella teleta]|uniref:Uncharacterized protein n=1 Tax=Capitella teleta TaxID=283909 RepID=R7UI81_CAPTE|nr:hypothetical protein CAPTEDRAFT_200476 [Capitella teleta]|eukprot:ELU06269.1 hypothetical protein CAPTEDRAFT_200476 [Capitella teleta]
MKGIIILLALSTTAYAGRDSPDSDLPSWEAGTVQTLTPPYLAIDKGIPGSQSPMAFISLREKSGNWSFIYDFEGSSGCKKHSVRLCIKKRIYLEDYKNFGIRYADRPRMIQLHEQVRSITHIGLLNTVEPATWNYNLTYV